MTDKPDTIPPGAPGDVLVVDDNSANLLAIEAALDRTAVNVVSADSGGAALRLLLDRDFALILLDVQMPRMDGFETARLIRSRERTRLTPIIFVTAHDRQNKDVLQAYDLGAVDFLFKPLVPEILRAKVQVFVQLQTQRFEVSRQNRLLREHERREHEQRMVEERQSWEQRLLRRQIEEERRAALAVNQKAEELARTVEELERVRSALTRSNRELEESNNRKTEFLAVLAHELRNPLAAIVSSIELLSTTNEGSSPVVEEKARSIIQRQVLHLRRLVDDLLDLSRITSDKIDLQKQTVAVTEIVEEAVSSCRALIEQHRHQFELSEPDAPGFIYADPVRIVQVLSNLLNNAARCTPPGGKLRLEVEVAAGELSFTVSDTGRGIRPEALERIFDMFVQERDGGGGLGIGLTLVRRLVELHGGSVAAHSAGLGKGSTFTVRLPVTRAVDESSKQSREAPASRSLRIVLVEDDPDIREMMQALLESWGHQVQVSETGTAGADLIVSSEPHVALVDIGLPGINGCDVARLVRYVHPPERVRLIALTGYSQEADRRRIENAGFDAHLVKPATAQTLQEALAHCAPLIEPSNAADGGAHSRVEPHVQD